jgi:alkane 1-monooxygenase
MKDLRYLMALTLPVTAFLGLYWEGYWVFATPIYAFVLVPILEVLLPVDATNASPEEQEINKKRKVFDWMLYSNIPVVYGLLGMLLYKTASSSLQIYQWVGLVVSVGIVLGTNGINVAHELGHRTHVMHRFLAKLLLLPSHYMHFYIEHNFGHHVHAATSEDPATARRNQTVYSFWITSVVRQYRNAWRIQHKLLRRGKAGFFDLKNDMVWYTLIQLGYLVLVFVFFGSLGLVTAVLAGVVGILMLETVNYIEHYGLLRQKNSSGRYERVREIHSWNSNHVMGRIMLYELTRHSDHHYKSNKKYQVLEYHDQSPQMPFGYPTSMVISLFPPVWFAIMNPRIPKGMYPSAR